jgi:hypothetical protein
MVEKGYQPIEMKNQEKKPTMATKSVILNAT